jgi:phosphoribosylanthranilate isomerase
MTTAAKICGLTTPEAVAAALAGGAGYVGFVFYRKSPRNIWPEDAATLAIRVRGKAKVVAVTVDADDGELDLIVKGLRPDYIQLHGKETPQRVQEVRDRFRTGVIRAVSVSTEAEINAASVFNDVADHLMFDAKAPVAAVEAGTDLPGGNGAAFDWTLMKGRRYSRPWFLAGGLDPWNVTEAISLSGAPIVDVSSGVERGPGVKDPALITAFLDAVRRA